MSGHRSQSNQEVSEPPDFVRLVDEIEIAAAGRTLEGKGRSACLAAYHEAPRGFSKVAARVMAESKDNPCGLLVWAISRGQHLKAQRAAELQDNDDSILF